MKKDKIEHESNKIRKDEGTSGVGIKKCIRCGRHCSITALQCERGEQYLKRLQRKDESSIPEKEESSGCRRERNQHRDVEREQCDGEHGRVHGHGGENHHGRHGCRMNGNNIQLEDGDDLRHIIRSCADHLYRRGGQKNGQRGILHILSHEEEITQRQLQDMLDIQPGSMSEILSKMEDKGLIERLKDDEDKRRMLVKLTRQGEEHVKEYRLGQRRQDPFSALQEEEKEQLKMLLLKLLTSWKQNRG